MDLSALAGPLMGILNIVVYVFVLIVVLAVLYMAWRWYSSQKKYSQFKCVIWGKDGFGQITQTTDQGGIFVDKRTKNKRLYLKKSGVGLSPDNVPYVPTGKTKVIYLLRTGLKNFSYIRPIISNPGVALGMTEEDVNWGLNAYERAKKQFAHNMLLQYMPYIGLAIASMVIMIIFIYFFKQFPVLSEVAAAFRDAAKSLALANSGATVIV